MRFGKAIPLLDTREGEQLLPDERLAQAASAAESELSSLLADGGKGQESGGVGYEAGKSDTPQPETNIS